MRSHCLHRYWLQSFKGCFASATVRDFLDMSDFLNLMDIVLDVDAASGIFNVSTGQGETIENVFNEVAKYLDTKLDAPVEVRAVGDDDVPEVVLDPAKTKEVFGWESKVGFEETITKMLQWYDEFGVGHIYSHLSSAK